MKPDRFIALPGRGVLAISGEEARSFLQGLITNDMAQVSPTRTIYAALLTPQGKFLHDFFVAERDGAFLVDCDAARKDDLLKRLKMYRLRARVDIADESAGWNVHALLPGDDEPGATEPFEGGIAFTDPRHAGLGARAILPAGSDPAAAGMSESTIEDYERRRLALGIPDGATDLVPDKSMPLESGFDELHGVSFTKGCFVGQEVTTRMKHRNLVKRRLFPVSLDAPVDTGTPVRSGDVEAGEIRSVRDGRGIALIRLDLADKGGLVAGNATVTPSRPDWAAF